MENKFGKIECRFSVLRQVAKLLFKSCAPNSQQLDSHSQHFQSHFQFRLKSEKSKLLKPGKANVSSTGQKKCRASRSRSSMTPHVPKTSQEKLKSSARMAKSRPNVVLYKWPRQSCTTCLWTLRTPKL